MFARILAKMNQHAGVTLILLAVLGTGGYAYQLNLMESRNACQVELNKAVTANIKIRTQIAQRSDDAKTALLSGVSTYLLLPPTEDEDEQTERHEDFLDLFRTFNKETLAVAAARADNPVPEIVGVCD